MKRLICSVGIVLSYFSGWMFCLFFGCCRMILCQFRWLDYVIIQMNRIDDELWIEVDVMVIVFSIMCKYGMNIFIVIQYMDINVYVKFDLWMLRMWLCCYLGQYGLCGEVLNREVRCIVVGLE